MIEGDTAMSASKTETETDPVKIWYKLLLDKVVKEMIRLEAVKGVAVQASPEWMVPNDILIAKVWGLGYEDDFIWTISIDKFIADFVAGPLAATPRDVARHFSLKWQMDADRIVEHEKAKAPPATTDKKMMDYSEQLVHKAELLYDLSSRDHVWEQTGATGE